MVVVPRFVRASISPVVVFVFVCMPVRTVMVLVFAVMPILAMVVLMFGVVPIVRVMMGVFVCMAIRTVMVLVFIFVVVARARLRPSTGHRDNQKRKNRGMFHGIGVANRVPVCEPTQAERPPSAVAMRSVNRVIALGVPGILAPRPPPNFGLLARLEFGSWPAWFTLGRWPQPRHRVRWNARTPREGGSFVYAAR